MSAPRRLAISFSIVVLVPAVAVVWLGVGAIADDRERLTRELQGRRERAAAQMADALTRAVDSTARRLRASAESLHLPIDQESLLVRWPAKFVEEATFAFEHVEQLEFRAQDLATVTAAYRELISAGNIGVRAGALLRLARAQYRFGQPDAALATFSELAGLTEARVAELPADLAARVAQCMILADLRRPLLRREASQLHDDLRRSRWPLEPDVWTHYVDQSAAWMGTTPSPFRESRQQVLLTVWNTVARSRDSRQTQGRFFADGFAVLWELNGNEFIALSASPAFQHREWFDAAATSVTDPTVQTAIVDGDGTSLWRERSDVPTMDREVVRTAADAGFPWTVVVADRNPQATDDDFRSRRRLLLSGLALIVLVVGAGAYFVGRAVSRELVVAELQSDFVSAVSHEFRTPLTALRQFTELLNAEHEPDAGKRQAFHRAQLRATDRLQRLVESVLDFGRMEAGARPYDVQTISAAELVRAVVEEFQRDGLPEDFNLELTIEAGRLDIRAERAALSRALWNLLDNAVKYSGAGRAIAVVARKRGQSIEIAVTDRGAGIPVSEQKRIFDKFVRGSTGRDHGIRGTGLGLAMVRHTVKEHRGSIELVSAPGKGSTFSLVLPTATTTEEAS